MVGFQALRQSLAFTSFIHARCRGGDDVRVVLAKQGPVSTGNFMVSGAWFQAQDHIEIRSTLHGVPPVILRRCRSPLGAAGVVPGAGAGDHPVFDGSPGVGISRGFYAPAVPVVSRLNCFGPLTGMPTTPWGTPHSSPRSGDL